ncbi:substrate-binding protein [Salinisphaera orenii]|nr:substrate-binding protein [Salinisphaera orenii]
MSSGHETDAALSRRSFMKSSAGVVGGLMVPSIFSLAYAADGDHPAVGNYPAGVQGDTVFVGISVPLTGPYSTEGADEQRGYELAIAQLNAGDSRIKKISPNTKQGVLGKKVVHEVADNETDPNTAVQANTRWIRDKKAMMITGSVSSAVAIACEKLAQREKTPYLACISGSNDTTGKDCQRYGFRSCPFAYNSAKAQAPILADALGKDRKAVYLVPDYTYGHTVYDSMTEFTEALGWKTVGKQLAPLGTSDFSSYLLNIANSDADVMVNIAFGADAANSTKQAKQFGILDKMAYVVPYMSPFLADEVGADIMQDVYGVQDFWWTMADDNQIAKDFVDAFEEKYGDKPRWSAAAAYMQTALWADAVERAGTWYPPAVVKAYEDESVTRDTIYGEAHWRACDHQLVRPIPVVKGKKPADMRNKDDFFEVVGMSGAEEVMPACDHFGCELGPYT